MSSILTPLLTEKTTQQMSNGLYVFMIDSQANKQTIAQELKALYDVTPISIRIVNLPAKKVTFRRKPGMRSVRRKAYVQLPAKQKIAGFESLTEPEKKETEKNKAAKETK